MQRRAIVLGSGLLATIVLGAFLLLAGGVLAQEPAAPAAPAIQLVKTVGTNPAICATTNSITLLPAGGPVYYCYEVTNTGDTALSLHTLVDDQLGPILTSFPYSLAPGASAFLTQSASITATTVNAATWTSFNPGPTDETSATDSAEVVVLVPSITLTKTVGTDPAVCAEADSITLPVGGGSVTYCYEVSNTGSMTLSLHTLADDRLGTILSNFPYSLVPGASAFLTQSVTITGTTVNTASWTAFNPGPVHETTSSASATVIVEHLLYLPVLRRE
jgi:archaellum component FlaG (FlaF/FlaG flagellin family)